MTLERVGKLSTRVLEELNGHSYYYATTRGDSQKLVNSSPLCQACFLTRALLPLMTGPLISPGQSTHVLTPNVLGDTVEVTIAAVADYASQAADGKLSVSGVFQVVITMIHGR